MTNLLAEALCVIYEYRVWWSLSRVFVVCSDSHLPKGPDDMEAKVICRVRIDFGTSTDSGPHLVHCTSAQCRSVFVDLHRSNSTSN